MATPLLLFLDFLVNNAWLGAIVFNTGLIIIAFLVPKKLLTPSGYFHGWILGVVIWGCLGWPGYGVVMFYFLVGSGVTRIGKAKKEALGIAEKRSGMRGPENVWGSALTGTLCALAILGLYQWPMAIGETGMVANGMVANGDDRLVWISLLSLGYVASFATKLSDTTATEVGKAYGKRTFLITTLRPVPAGTEGAISLEGTLAGIAASLAIALVGWGLGCITPLGIGICGVAAFVATNLESVIGATIQTQFSWLTNEMVNWVNTMIGATVAIVLGLIWA
jgi:uncharacterized membrane protein